MEWVSVGTVGVGYGSCGLLRHAWERCGTVLCDVMWQSARGMAGHGAERLVAASLGSHDEFRCCVLRIVMDAAVRMAVMEGAELKRLRKKLGLSLAQASRQVEVTPRTWARWEAGDQKIPEGAVKLFLILNKLEKVK